MKIYSVFDPEFKPYGQVVTGMDETVAELLKRLSRSSPPPYVVKRVLLGQQCIVRIVGTQR